MNSTTSLRGYRLAVKLWGEAEFEQFAADAFGPPEPILLSHLLDQRHGFWREWGTTTAVTRFISPEETKALAMPVEEGAGFDDEEGFLPVFDATDEEDEPEAIGWREDGLFGLTVKDDELLTQESIFGDEVGSTAREVYGRAENNRMAGGLGEMEEGLFSCPFHWSGSILAMEGLK